MQYVNISMHCMVYTCSLHQINLTDHDQDQREPANRMPNATAGTGGRPASTKPGAKESIFPLRVSPPKVIL